MEFNKDKSNGKFICTTCKETFTLKGSLTRHHNERHRYGDYDEIKFSCPKCKDGFTRYQNLIRHCEVVHKNKSGKCSECGEKFLDLKELCKHIQMDHNKFGNKDLKYPKNEECHICGNKFTSKNNLNRHMENIHNVRCKKPPSILCPLCNIAVQTISILDKHLTVDHDVELKVENANFDSIEDFKKWKREVEKEDSAFFYSKCTVDNRSYYECHRSGFCRTTGPDKKLKRSSSTKIGKHCPARMVITRIGKRVNAHFQRTHVGHSLTIRSSIKKEKKELPNEIEEDRILNEIVDENYESSAAEENVEENFISPKTHFKELVNIALNLAEYATEEAILEAIPQVENIIKFLRQNQISQETAD